MRVFKDTKKMVLLAVLSALGSILMLVEIPYPLVPFLKFDISDVAVLLTAQSFGLGPAIFVAAAKSIISLLVRGMNSPLGIGLIAAFISSSTAAACYIFAKKRFGEAKGIQRVIRFIIVATGVSIVMTISNYLFITPIFLTGGNSLWFTQLPFAVTLSTFNLPFEFPFELGYAATVLIVYVPFNFLQGFISMFLYEMIAPRVLEPLQKILER